MSDPVRIRVSIPGRGQITVYNHVQSTASQTWTIVHNLGRQYPQVIAFDTDGTQIVGAISYPSANVLVIEFNTPVSGTAHLT